MQGQNKSYILLVDTENAENTVEEYTLNSQGIDYWIQVLHGTWNPQAIDKITQQGIIEIFKAAAAIAPYDEHNHKGFWISAERPTLKEYKEHYEKTEECSAEMDLLTVYYNQDYPEERQWYYCELVYHNDKGKDYYGIFVNYNYVLSIGDINATGHPLDAKEFTDWLLEETKKVVISMQSGLYNSNVENNLPLQYRFGRINRKDYYDICLEKREAIRKDLTEKDISDFINFFDTEKEIKGLPEMTARYYYEACACAYQSVNYDTKCCPYHDSKEEHVHYKTEYTPKEEYFRHADGRDDGLCNVPMDSARDFEEWFNGKGQYYNMTGHHPWEIRTSLSLSHSIHLYAWKDLDGWKLQLTGSDITACNEIVRYYLNMRRAGYPVELQDGKRILKRYTEDDEIGVLPQSLDAWYGYANSHFHGEVLDVINLPGLTVPAFKKVAEKVKWQPEQQVMLLGSVDN